MKKLMICLTALFLSLTFIPTDVKADVSNAAYATEAKKADEKAKVGVLLARLESIKDMDKSELNSVEKKNLRKEVRSIKDELKNLQGGVYLSVGAIIVIAILLIVLL